MKLVLAHGPDTKAWTLPLQYNAFKGSLDRNTRLFQRTAKNADFYELLEEASMQFLCMERTV